MQSLPKPEPSCKRSTSPLRQAFVEAIQAPAPSVEERLSALTQQHEQFLGPRLARREQRLFDRLRRYIAELARIEKTSASQWHPRVMFNTVEGPCRVLDHGDHVALIPRWSLIFVVDRRQAALITARAKLKLVLDRLARLRNLAHARHRESARLQRQNNLLRGFLTPTRRRRVQ